MLARVAQTVEHLVEAEGVGSSKLPPGTNFQGPLAQIGERLPCKQEAAGAEPAGSTIPFIPG